MSLVVLAKCEIPIHNSTAEICDYISNNCKGWQNIYLRQYYCSVSSHPIMANLLLGVFVMIIIGFLFLVLGLLASDYLVPNLSALSDALKMDEKLSGLTLLAFANGSPDVLSTYVAMKQGITSMAIGELLGSANFSLTVVIGVLAIYKPFKVNQTTFMRDLVIFSILLLISLYILYDGVITIAESIVLCLLYVIFIIYNVLIPSDDYHHTELQQQQEDMVETNNADIENNIAAENDDGGSCVSVASQNSNVSMNDYYFAHNLDNLEQGRGYKIALLDSLKLAWLYHRKTNVPNNEVERLQSIEPESPPKSSMTGESTGLSIPTDNINYTNNKSSNQTLTALDDIVLKKQQHDLLDVPITEASPSISRSSSTSRLKYKNDYQILYPNKSTMPSKAGSFSDVRVSSNELAKSNDISTIPIIIEPDDNETLSFPESNSTLYQQRPLKQDSLSASADHLDLLLKPERPALRDNIRNRHSSPELTYIQPAARDLSSSSALIPYVEYNRTTSVFRKLVPIEMFTGAISIDEKILAILIIPLSAVFNALIPVSLPSELTGEIYEHELSISSKLFHAQIGFLPLLLFDFDATIPVLLFAFLLPILSVGVKLMLNKRHYRLFIAPALALAGFFGVLKLITLAAGAVIAVLKDIAEIYSLNESILGLTILSLGNSVGDVVTNLALAGLGRPLTGLHACFGSPLLYILFGIGICSLIVQLSASQTKSIEFTVDRSLKLTALSIIAMLIIYTITLPLNNWIFKRWVGYLGLCMWFLVTTANFILHGHR